MGRVDATCYIERSKVREILIASDIDNESTRAVLQEVDALPIVTAADFSAPAQGVWQSMDTAPKEGQFLALMHDGREPPNPFHEIIEWNSHGGNKGRWMKDNGGEYHEKAEAMGYCRPLFWMPLPTTTLPSTDSEVSPHAG